VDHLADWVVHAAAYLEDIQLADAQVGLGLALI